MAHQFGTGMQQKTLPLEACIPFQVRKQAFPLPVADSPSGRDGCLCKVNGTSSPSCWQAG